MIAHVTMRHERQRDCRHYRPPEAPGPRLELGEAHALRAELTATGRCQPSAVIAGGGRGPRFATAALECEHHRDRCAADEGIRCGFCAGGTLSAAIIELLARCDQLVLDGTGRPTRGVFCRRSRTSSITVTFCSLVWDGMPAGAMGGTGDVVEYARRLQRRIAPESNSAPRHRQS